MNSPSIPVVNLTPSLLERARMWEYTTDSRQHEAEPGLQPVHDVPVTDLRNRVVGTQVQLADGTVLWALLGNMDPHDARATQHFLTLSLWLGDAWFYLARYHDVTYEEHGPGALAAALRRPIAAVFPITYDVRDLVHGDRHALAGQILAAPTERLSRAELIEWTVRSG